jgi:hypothetical protein
VDAPPVRGDVLVAKGFQGGLIDSGLVRRLHLQEEFGFASTSHMERLVAVLIPTLYACAHLLIAYVAIQLPTAFWYLVNIRDRFHECHVSDRDFWNPYSAQEMTPAKCAGLFESAIDVRAEDTRWRSSANLFALPAKPLALRNERHTVTFLVHSQVTPVAENDGIRVLAVPVVAD